MSESNKCATFSKSRLQRLADTSDWIPYRTNTWTRQVNRGREFRTREFDISLNRKSLQRVYLVLKHQLTYTVTLAKEKAVVVVVVVVLGGCTWMLGRNPAVGLEI